MRKQADIAQVLKAINQVITMKSSAVPLHEPLLGGNEWKYVKECLDSGWISSAGRYVMELEERIREFTGVKHAIAVNSGTAALHAALLAAGVSGNDEVLLPALTFVATANAIQYCGAVPHFVDVEERSLGVDPHKLRAYLQDIAVFSQDRWINKNTGRRLKALVVMHTFGHPADMEALIALCEAYSLELIEDAAQALGSYYKGQHVGGLGRISAISFNGNKIVTTGGGGAVLTNDESLALWVRHVTTTAKLPHPWAYEHDQLGYNYRMPNLNAALGCAQLEQLPDFIARKRKLAHAYKAAFSTVLGVKLYTEAGYARSNYWLNALILQEADRGVRDEILKQTHAQGLMTRPCWNLLHKLRVYTNSPRMDLSISEQLEQRIINLPSSVSLVAGERA
ncbi:LegC family aminotransferase [Paenibacillus terreus]|uniref:LegC family aminotransferase n=1 Tax=Paenibacillus terreus TaxID=1387834 RepID=A0ABV5BAI0_9BACL